MALRTSLTEHLGRLARVQPDALAIAEDERRLTYKALASTVDRRKLEWMRLANRGVALHLSRASDEAVALLALEALGSTVYLISGSSPHATDSEAPWEYIVNDDGLQHLKGAGADAVPTTAARAGTFSAAGAVPGEALATATSQSVAASALIEPRVVVRTSGTTGVPKDVFHTWTTLTRPVRIDSRYSSTRWLSLYPLNRYAGLQVFVQAFLNGGCVVFAPSREPEAVVRTMKQQDVTHASGTPSFWRSLLLFGPREKLRSLRLQQVTLGGEAVDQEILDGLRDFFPKARLVHIYATTELGRCFSVADGKAGFPASYLEAGLPDGVEIKLEGSELYVRSSNRMLGYRSGVSVREKAGGWFATGDLVEVRGDRVFFLGREDDIVNVGGHKVAPAEIEQILRQVEGVRDIRVFGRKSSITGRLLCAEVVRAPDYSRDVVSDVRAFAERTLADHQIPRLIKEVNQIMLSESGKVLRT